MASKLVVHAAAVLTFALPRLHEAAVADVTTAVARSDANEAASSARLSSENLRHKQSLAAIMQNMTRQSALEVLRKSPSVTPTVLSMLQGALAEIAHASNLKGLHYSGQASLRARAQKGLMQVQQDPYSGVEKAKMMLNEMIYEVMEKYDIETTRCTDFYTTQCGLMEECRQDISRYNARSAEARSQILGAQASINLCEVQLPVLGREREDVDSHCERELGQLRAELKILRGDIEVMTGILEMTDCEAQSFAQIDAPALLNCEDQCTGTPFVAFGQSALRRKLNELRSPLAQGMLHDHLADVLGYRKSPNATTPLLLLQGEEYDNGLTGSDQFARSGPVLTTPDGDVITNFTNPPLPRTKVPGNPCTDPHAGAPSTVHKRAAKCSVGRSPNCPKLQERFLLIQADMLDRKDMLEEMLGELETHCRMETKRLDSEIENFETQKSTSDTKLAEGTEAENVAGENSRLQGEQHDVLEKDMRKTMKQCHENYIAFETEMCGLRKIRGELFKMKGTDKIPFFQDCEVSEWGAGECSASCGGGSRVLTRTITAQINGGAKCPPLKKLQKCNHFPCAVHCKMDEWSEWSECSADCGGGVKERMRNVLTPMENNGEPCGETSESRSCNIHSCDKDCILSEWTDWSKCSKACAGGSQTKIRHMNRRAVGMGTCADPKSTERLLRRKCNAEPCFKKSLDLSLQCEAELDVVLILDGSSSIGAEGWAATKKAAKMLLSAFKGGAVNTEVSLLLYSGSFFWSTAKKCLGVSSETVDLETDCNVKWIQHLTTDVAGTVDKVDKLTWPKGGTFTSLALSEASAELHLGRKNAKSIVIVVTDGKPLSSRKTGIAADKLRDVARLMWVPVTKYAPLDKIKSWASSPWEENVVEVEDFTKLATLQTIDSLIADLCPSPF